MRIDSHHHLWRISRGDYDWMTPDLGVIYRDFEPKDMEPLLASAGIDGTIVVQAAETTCETGFLLQLADQTPWILGVVGWVDMTASDAEATLDRLARNTKFKGIRPMIQGIADDDWILDNGLDPAFKALVERGLTFDALVLPRHLPNLLRRLELVPDLACVIDHAAKPHIATGKIDQWKADMAAIAANTNACCKFSGFVTEAGPDYTIDTLRPVAEHLIEVFGPSRLMFGSDWPVLNLAGDYAGWIAMAEDLTSSFDAAQKASFWGGNATEFYRLSR